MANRARDLKAVRENSKEGRQRAATMKKADIVPARTTCCRTSAQAPAPSIGGAHRAGHRDQRGGHRRALDHAEAHRSRQEGIAGGTERDQEERQAARDQQGCHLRFAESQRRRVCGQRGECRSDRPRSEGRPAGGRRPALGYGLRLYERRAEAEVTEGHRERRQRDGESSDAVVGRRQQPGEDDHPREPDGLDRHLRADRPDGTALQRASDVLRRDVRQGLRDQGAPRGPDVARTAARPSGGEAGPSSIALGDDALLGRRASRCPAPDRPSALRGRPPARSGVTSGRGPRCRPRGSGSPGRIPRARRQGARSRELSSTPSHSLRVGDPGRRSTMTRKIEPRVQRTSLISRCGASWKWRPRRVWRRGLWIVLLCTIRIGRPCSANSRSQNVRARKPRSSP